VPALFNAGAFLDSVIVASLALMAVVTSYLTSKSGPAFNQAKGRRLCWSLARSAVVLPTALLALGSVVALVRFHLNSLWLVLGGAVIGLLVHMTHI